MCAASNRLDLYIDIFEAKNQLASVLPTLTPGELVKAILEEFRELEYLSNAPGAYRLIKADGTTLKQADSLEAQQLNSKSRLILVEQEVRPPEGTQLPGQPVFLRETQTGEVYKLNWQPAVIGRLDKNQPNDKLAVNLESHSGGQYISRRHAQIIEENGRFYLESLSQRNPTFIIKNGAAPRPVTQKELLDHGDLIQLLDRNKITLKFIIRPKVTEQGA